jgi:hypothetical protein
VNVSTSFNHDLIEREIASPYNQLRGSRDQAVVLVKRSKEVSDSQKKKEIQKLIDKYNDIENVDLKAP